MGKYSRQVEIAGKPHTIEKMVWGQYEELTDYFAKLVTGEDAMKLIKGGPKAAGMELMAKMPTQLREGLSIATKIPSAALKQAYPEDMIALFESVFELNNFTELVSRLKKAMGLVVDQLAALPGTKPSQPSPASSAGRQKPA